MFIKNHIVPDEWRRKISESNKGKIPWIKGGTHTEETKRKISESHKGIKFSEEHKKNLSIAQKKYYKNNPEVRYRLKKMMQGNPVWNKGKEWEKIRFNLIPSPEFSYLLGVRYGDGRLMKHKKTSQFSFGLLATDRDFVEEFEKCCCKVVGKNPTRIWEAKLRENCKQTYGWSIYSKKLYNFLKQDIDTQKYIINKYPNDFLRGFWDSEGSVTICNRIRHRSLTATNRKRNLLEFVKKLMEKQGYTIYFHKRKREYSKYFEGTKDGFIYEIKISNIGDIFSFYKNIRFSISRKQEKLKGCLNEISENENKTRGWQIRKEIREYESHYKGLPNIDNPW